MSLQMLLQRTALILEPKNEIGDVLVEKPLSAVMIFKDFM
jgi:hypothetical protein